MLTAFTRKLGKTQGRISPSQAQPFEGDKVVCLGSDTPGQVSELNVGDSIKLFTEDLDSALVRFRAHVRGPSADAAGVRWVFMWGVADESGTIVEQQGFRVLRPGQEIDILDGAIVLNGFEAQRSPCFALQLFGDVT